MVCNRGLRCCQRRSMEQLRQLSNSGAPPPHPLLPVLEGACTLPLFEFGPIKGPPAYPELLRQGSDPFLDTECSLRAQEASHVLQRLLAGGSELQAFRMQKMDPRMVTVACTDAPDVCNLRRTC